MNKRSTFQKILLPVLALLPGFTQAAAESSVSDNTVIAYVLVGLLLFVILGILIATLAIVRLTMVIHQQQAEKAGKTAPAQTLWARLKEKYITGELIPLEQEHAAMIDHSYDGIQELDHRMPPWLRFLFLGTIAFAVVYLVNFTFLGLVQTSEQEYVAEVNQAQKEIEAYKLVAAKGINEDNVTLASETSAISSGKAIFEQNCKACHGAAGEGGVGPNLTDEYWLHGGDIKHVFKTIKYGIPQKGMISWEQKLQPDQIQQVASYVLSLQGSNPPNGKAPQGEKELQAKSDKPGDGKISLR